MNDKKLYKVTITDENGKVTHEVESDCIIAAISDPSRSKEGKSAIHGVYITDCPTVTITSAFKALKKSQARGYCKKSYARYGACYGEPLGVGEEIRHKS